MAGRDRAFYAAAALVGDRTKGTPVVVVGAPLDQGAYQSLADRTGDAIGLSDGTRLLESAGPEQPRRALATLAARPGRGVRLDETSSYAGTFVPVDGKLSLLTVFAAPAPPRTAKIGAPVALLGGALLLGGASLLLRTRRRPRST
jgi:hypothetical protein